MGGGAFLDGRLVKAVMRNYQASTYSSIPVSTYRKDNGAANLD